MSIGETNLRTLLSTMEPRLQAPVYVFATVPEGQSVPDAFEALMSFREAEGTTLIIAEEAARQLEIAGSFRSRMITLTVHSSLESIGFLGVITERLGAKGIPMNAVSAFYHDHLFIPTERADEAMRLLHQLADEHRQESAHCKDSHGD